MKKLSVIGDSHAKVVFKTLVPLLEAKGFQTVHRRAENGWSMKKHIREGTLDKVLMTKPDLILVSLGGNNHDLSQNSYKETIDRFLEVANRIGAKLVWVGPTTSDTGKAPNTEKRHAWTEQFLSKYIPKKGKYISMRAFTAQGQGKDGVHYPWNFYKRWAQHVADRVDLPTNYVPIAIAGGMSLIGLITLGAVLYNKQSTKVLGSKMQRTIPEHKETIEYYLNGKKKIVSADLIASGNFSAVYRVPEGVLIKVNISLDKTKKLISSLGKEGFLQKITSFFFRDKHIPQLKYLGKTDPPTETVIKNMTFGKGATDLFFSPYYRPIQPSDPVFETAQFLGKTFKDWKQNVFPDLCFRLQKQYPERHLQLQGWDYSKSGMVEKATAFRESYLQYLKSKASDQPQIKSIIKSLQKIHNFLIEKTKGKTSKKDAIDFDNFPIHNLAIDTGGNLILLDIIYPTPLTTCRKYITEYIPPKFTAQDQQFFQELLKQFEE
jgi:hypothetical protein